MMKNRFFVAALGLLAVVACKTEGTTTTNKVAKHNLETVTVDTDSESEKFSYSIGMIIGNTLKNSGIDSVDYAVVDRAFDDDENEQIAYTITAREAQALMGEEVDMSKVDQKIIKRAIYDVFEGDTTLLSLPEVSQAYQGFMQNNQTRVAQNNLDAGKAFLESNKVKEGIKVTDSGLQYQLVQEGTGEMPGKSDVVELWWSGETLAGKEFKKDMDEATSYVDLKDGTADFAAMAEAAALFPGGSEFILYVPSNLAFGEARLSPELGPNSTVKIHVSKTKIVDSETKNLFRKQIKEMRKRAQAQQRR